MGIEPLVFFDTRDGVKTQFTARLLDLSTEGVATLDEAFGDYCPSGSSYVSSRLTHDVFLRAGEDDSRRSCEVARYETDGFSGSLVLFLGAINSFEEGLVSGLYQTLGTVPAIRSVLEKNDLYSFER